LQSDDGELQHFINSSKFGEVRRKMMEKIAAVLIVFGGLFLIEFGTSGQQVIELECRFGNFCDQLSVKKEN
jgi:hypothetical protein